MWLDEFLRASRHVQGHEVDELRHRLRTRDRTTRRRRLATEERLEHLERGLARVALLARTLAELGLARGAFTEEELRERLAECDLADGAGDGGIDPSVVMPGEEKLAELDPLPPGPERGLDHP